MSDFKELKVWQKAHLLALNAYRTAANIRGSQLAGLKSQITRAAMSIPANIVESRGQMSRKESARFMRMAVNSSTELEYHLVVAHDLGAISTADRLTLTAQLIEVRKMTYGMIRYLTGGAENLESQRSEVEVDRLKVRGQV
jgi:four helix bundle protein